MRKNSFRLTITNYKAYLVKQIKNNIQQIENTDILQNTRKFMMCNLLTQMS